MRTHTRILSVALSVITGFGFLPAKLQATSPQPSGAIAYPRGDIDRDTFPDYTLAHIDTRQAAFWFMNGNTVRARTYGPTPPANWEIYDVGARFNATANAGLMLYNRDTGQTAVWFVNQSGAFVSGTYGPTLPFGWYIRAAVDMDNNGSTDYVLQNDDTQQTAIWFLNFPARTGAVYGPTLPSGWNLAEAVDMNNDTHPDFVLVNSDTRQTAIWYMNGATFTGSVYGPTLPSEWYLEGVADFNRDGMPDYILQQAGTRRTAIWYMSGVHYSSGVYGPTTPPLYRLVSP